MTIPTGRGRWLIVAAAAAAALLLLSQTALNTGAQQRVQMQVQIPKSIHDEHEAIQADLLALCLKGSAVGKSARALASVLEPHFEREEQIALPPLGVLQSLATTTGVSPSALSIVPLSDSLRAELPVMLHDHRVVGAALLHLAAIGNALGDREVVALTRRLQQHARSEEEVLYPAAILAGEVVRARTRALSSALQVPVTSQTARPQDRPTARPQD
jgi:hypothetical protein